MCENQAPPLACFYAYTSEDMHVLSDARSMSIDIDYFRNYMRSRLKHGDMEDVAREELAKVYEAFCGLMSRYSDY